MSKLNLPLLFLLLVLWLVGGTWFFNENYKTSSTETASECSIPFSITDGNFNTSSDKIFFFDNSDWEPMIPVQALASLKSIALYLSNSEKKKLLLTGQFNLEESNNSDFENIGIARAEAIKKELVDYGAPSKNIKVSSDEIEELNLTCGKIFGGVDFSFGPVKTGNTENVKTPIAAKAETVEKNKTKNETSSPPTTLPDYSTYSTIYYKNNQFVPEIDNDLENWFKYLNEYLDDHPKARLLLTGHTDKSSSSDKALRLGKYRARKLRDALLKYGIEKKRIKTVTEGSKEPLASNKTKEGRMKNRRVVISIID